jgi:serine/threonine protein kinase
MTLTLVNNRYQVLRVLGNGGFGETFLAEDTQMPSSRRCVVKQLKPVADNPQVYQLVKERFQQEAAILEDLGDRSDQIPRLYAYFVDNDQFYLVQEYVEGLTLTQKLQQQGLLTESAVKDILINILPVLDYVHNKRIVHRDIKPDNIILRFADGKPVLIDFGAVKVTMGTIITNSGNSNQSIVIGTPGFMPMEQSVGRPVFSSDLYSLGLTAIYLLTGKLPQELGTDPATGDFLWRNHVGNINPDFAQVLNKAIQPVARDRYLNARDMLAALQTPSVAPTVPYQQPYTPVAPTVPVYQQPPTPVPPTTPVYQQPPNPTPQPTPVYQQPPTPTPQPTPVYQQPSPPIAQPPTAPAPYQPTPTPPTVTQTNGLAAWQQGVMIGGIVGALIVGGFLVFNSWNQPVKTPNVVESTPSPVASASNPPVSEGQEKPTQIVSNTPNSVPQPPITNEQPNNPPESPNPEPSEAPINPPDNNSPSPDGGSGLTSTITQEQAQGLINNWLQAKRVMFAPPYDSQPAEELTTGSQYNSVNGSINSLKNDGQYYQYGVQKIDSVDEFSVDGEQAIIQVQVTEERTLFDRNGNVIPKETDFKTRTVRYNLQFVDQSWKIASTEILKN